jgi:hypothetical protein
MFTSLLLGSDQASTFKQNKRRGGGGHLVGIKCYFARRNFLCSVMMKLLPPIKEV